MKKNDFIILKNGLEEFRSFKTIEELLIFLDVKDFSEGDAERLIKDFENLAFVDINGFEVIPLFDKWE